MASLFESVGIFSDFSDFFLPTLLVFAVLYAVLLKTKFLTENKNINMIIAGVVALLVGFSGTAKFISTLTPYLAGLFIIGFLIMLIFIFLGSQNPDAFGKKISDTIFGSKAYVIIIILICVIFVFYTVGQLYGSSLSGLTSTQPVVSQEGGEYVVTSAADSYALPSASTCDFANIQAVQH